MVPARGSKSEPWNARACASRGFGRVEQVDRRTQFHALAMPLFQIAQARSRMRQMQRTVRCGFAVYILPLDQRPDQLWCIGQQTDQLQARLLAHLRHHVVRRQPQTGVDETDIAARATMADRVRLEHDDRGTAPRRLKSCRVPSEPTTYDDEVGIRVRRQRRRSRRSPRCWHATDG
jgi:hypothetical protein